MAGSHFTPLILSPYVDENNGRIRYKSRNFSIKGADVSYDLSNVKLSVRESWKLTISTNDETPPEKKARLDSGNKDEPNMTSLTAGLENEKEVSYNKNEFEQSDTHMNSIKNDHRETLSSRSKGATFNAAS